MREIILLIHILLAIVWAGGIMFIGWGVYPASMSLSLTIQRKLLTSLMKWAHHFLTLAGFFVIVTGILLGTILGPIRTWDILWDTAYGNTWLAALLIGTFTLVWGIIVGYREMMMIFTDDFLWREAEDGNKKPLTRELIRLAALESVEVICFIILIYLMISL
ncbi:hypothetical protein CIL05_10040 [Virgibacillus profundi]|uniref:Copper resistance protein D domain-containing protein n=1 Tax=Virgibacillus profundi TaxID=2024555 RepID=A0A2A2IDP9_9BACI|nr:hypothetical protein [Virgibacillus profundi]PAV29702.1 hypothetical protein CIL05_10040 [Virgibacillus profundi]PXY53874.1 hypothetical protein CIT14_10135 [Virgibacillus profundi]